MATYKDRRNRNKIVELNEDDKSDLLLAFNLFKNNRGRKFLKIFISLFNIRKTQ